MTSPGSEQADVGVLLRQWRQRRHVTQLDLALGAGVSARHLSFVETGRARPTSAMIVRLAERLDVPLRERNRLLLAGGWAPVYPERGLGAPQLDAVRTALRELLTAHEPYPAVVVDRHWQLVEANTGLGLFTEGCAAQLLEPPVNVLRLCLHPDGMAPRIRNLPQWRARLLARLQRQADMSADPDLRELHRELAGYPGGSAAADPDPLVATVVVALRYCYRDTELSLLSTTAVFGAPLDLTVAELAIESFYPADSRTRQRLAALIP